MDAYPLIRLIPVAQVARASFGSTRLAETGHAVRVEQPGGPPELWFPASAINESTLASLHPDLYRRGAGNLSGYVAFHHDRMDLELVEPSALDGEEVRTRFPNWGDAAHLIDLLDVRPDVGGDGGEARPGRYLSGSRADWRRPVTEGSQVLGQAIVAAGRHAPDRRVVSASMVFTRVADANAPYAIDLTPLSTGRTFTALQARAVQGERLCAAGTLLLDVSSPDVIAHAEPPPKVPGPHESTPYDMSVTGRELRFVDAAYTGDPDAPLGPPEIDAWVRFASVPEDPPLHAGLLAQFTGHISIAAAMRPHAGVGQDQAHRSLSTAINAISLSIHRDVRADEWLLYHHRSTSAAAGMTHSECRVHDEAGALVASFTVDAMVRGFTDPAEAADARTAL